MQKFVCILMLICVLVPATKAQIAGMSTLSVLDMSSSARTAGLGMDYLSVYDNDLNVAIDNPSLISERLDSKLTLNYVGLFAGVKFGSATYAHTTKNFGTFLYGLHFNSYGTFEGYDENENPTGSFFAADYMVQVGWGMPIDSNFSIGANLKPVLSQYEHYTAWALALDLCGTYVSDSRRFSATLMARNFGAQFYTFDLTVEHLPFELSAALSYKLENAPFRLFLAATELQHWNLRYSDPLNPTSTLDPFTGEMHGETLVAGVADNMFRHFLAGIELNLGKAFYARLGYNYRQTKEMQGASAFNTSGFSYGFGFRIKGFDFAFARSNYHFGQAPNYISITKTL